MSDPRIESDSLRLYRTIRAADGAPYPSATIVERVFANERWLFQVAESLRLADDVTAG